MSHVVFFLCHNCLNLVLHINHHRELVGAQFFLDLTADAGSQTVSSCGEVTGRLKAFWGSLAVAVRLQNDKLAILHGVSQLRASTFVAAALETALIVHF